MLRLILPLLLAALLLPSPSLADGPPAEREWSVQIGAVGFLAPEYEGGSRYQVQAFPSLDVTWRDRAFLNVRQGLGLWLLRGEPLRLGASLGYAFGRDEDDASRLDGLGDVDGGALLNLFAGKGLPGGFELGARLGHQVTGEETGSQVSLSLGYARPVGRKLFFKPSAGLTWASAEAMEAYFGVTPSQAARSGLTAYEADAGLKSAGVQVFALYRLAGPWALQGFAGWERLLGDAADSPVTTEEDQFRLGIGISYSF